MATVPYRMSRHSVYLFHVHLVFTTKYRRKVFGTRHIEAMRAIFTAVCTQCDTERAEFDGETDHVHLLVNYPPHVQLSALVSTLKGVSSRKLR